MDFQSFKSLTADSIRPYAPTLFLPYLTAVLCALPFAALSFGVILLFTGILGAAFELNVIDSIVSDKRGFKEYFDTYDLKLFLLCLFRRLIVLGFTVLLIIPGIIKALDFSMSVYLYKENKTRKIIAILEDSREMMKGHRTELLRIYIGALGAVLITVLTLGVLAIWTLPYIKGLKANYYLSLRALSQSAHTGTVPENTES